MVIDTAARRVATADATVVTIREDTMSTHATSVRRAVAMTPIGELLLVARGEAVCEIRLPDPSTDLPGATQEGSPPRSAVAPSAAASHVVAASPVAAPPVGAPAQPAADAVLDEARRQLDEYFAGERREFDLPLRLEGTPFQRQVWDALRSVGYGETVTYSQLARAIGRPGAARAVGAALASNPLPLVLPCHRVVGAHGDLRGFGGGIARKRYLLEAETAHPRA